LWGFLCLKIFELGQVVGIQDEFVVISWKLGISMCVI